MSRPQKFIVEDEELVSENCQGYVVEKNCVFTLGYRFN